MRDTPSYRPATFLLLEGCTAPGYGPERTYQLFQRHVKDVLTVTKQIVEESGATSAELCCARPAWRWVKQ